MNTKRCIYTLDISGKCLCTDAGGEFTLISLTNSLIRNILVWEINIWAKHRLAITEFVGQTGCLSYIFIYVTKSSFHISQKMTNINVRLKKFVGTGRNLSPMIKVNSNSLN